MRYLFKSHWLEGVEIKKAPGRIFPLVNPTHIILHYDVCHSVEMNTAAQFASGFFYHVAIDGSDHDEHGVRVRQHVPLNRRGSASKGWNDRAVNVVIVNPGPLIRGADGKLRTTYGKEWSESDAVPGTHGSGLAPFNWQNWAAYHHEERDAVLGVCEAIIRELPSINTICGHDYVSPGRKFDPGPAADDAILAYLRAAFPKMNVPTVEKRG